MLDFFRRGVKTWVAKVLLFVLIISFAVWGIGDVFTSITGGTVARVGETEVEAEDFARRIRRQQMAITQQRGELIDLATLRAAGIDQSILSGMVRDAAFAEELQSLELAVPAESVADAIRTNAAFQDGQGGFSQYAYIDVLSREGFSTQEYEALTKELLGQEIVARAITPGGADLPGAAETIAAWQGERRAVSMLAMTPEEAADPGTPSDSDLQAFYDADPDRFIEPERRWGTYLHIDPAALAEDLAPTAEEVRAEYDANIDNYTIQPSRTIELIDFPDSAAAANAIARLNDGTATYEEIAAEQNVAIENLSLGLVMEADLAPAAAEAVFALEERGFAGPVETLSGYAIYNVTAVELGSVTPFADLEEAISLNLAARRARDEVPRRANEIDEIRADGAEMAEIAERTGLTLQSFAGLAGDGTVDEGEAPSLAADARFLAEVQQASTGQERDLLELSDGGYALVMIDRIKDGYLPEMDEIKAKVTDAWDHEQRLTALEARAIEITQQAGDGGIDAVAATLVSEAVDFPGYSRGQFPEIFATAITEQIFDAELGSIVIGRSNADQSVLIAQVKTITGLEPDQLSQNTEMASRTIRTGIQRDQLEMFSRALEERHGAEINPTAIDGVFEQLNQMGHGY